MSDGIMAGFAKEHQVVWVDGDRHVAVLIRDRNTMVDMSAISNEAAAHLTATVCHGDDVGSDALPFG